LNNLLPGYILLAGAPPPPGHLRSRLPDLALAPHTTYPAPGHAPWQAGGIALPLGRRLPRTGCAAAPLSVSATPANAGWMQRE